jgi:PBSX family phage terminase large subunit
MGRTLDIQYSPLESQRRFHQSKARFKGYSGGVGSGKSAALCQETVRLAFLNPGRTGLLGAPTYGMLRDATLATLLDILDGNGIAYDFNKSEYTLRFKQGGSKILLRSLDEFERLRGTNLAWFGVDELSYVAEEAWMRLEARLRDPLAKRLCGFGVWTPKGHDWLWKRFVKEPVAGYELIQARSFENVYLLKAVPDFYERLKASYDETFYRQEALGEYVAAGSGLVYREFRREEHVGAIEANPVEPLFWAVDFNVDPMCSVVAQKKGDDVLVLDEIVLEQATTFDACSEFHRRYWDHPGEIVVYGDASGNNLKTSGTTDYQMIRQFFAKHRTRPVKYLVPSKNPAVRDRVLMVNSMLRSAEGRIRLRLSPKCKGLIRDFEEVTYKADSGVIDKTRDLKLTHLSDALGYLIWQECRPQPSFGEQGRRLL